MQSTLNSIMAVKVNDCAQWSEASATPAIIFSPAEFTMQRERQQGSPRDAGIVQWERKEKWRESCVKRWRDRQSHVTTLLLDYIEFSRANQIARKVKQPPHPLYLCPVTVIPLSSSSSLVLSLSLSPGCCNMISLHKDVSGV